MSIENSLEQFQQDSWEQFVSDEENQAKFQSWCLTIRAKSAPNQQEFADWIEASLERQDLGMASMVVGYYDQAVALAKDHGEKGGIFYRGFWFSGLCSAQFDTLFNVYTAGLRTE